MENLAENLGTVTVFPATAIGNTSKTLLGKHGDCPQVF